jgi:hypothetical protein
MWMNRFEVEHAAACIRESAARRAAVFLADYTRLVDEISDGWAYWRYGTRCADRLGAIVSGCVRGGGADDEAVEDACNRIIRFLRRCRQTKDNPDVQAWVREHVARCCATTGDGT